MRQPDRRGADGVPADLAVLRRLQVQALRKLTHLVRRFFQVLFARPLDEAERAEVAGTLDPPLLALFDAQAVADQRHAMTVMRRVAASTDDRDVLVAALVHDVGKGGVRIGAVGRSVATVVDALHLPMTGRMAAYRGHGPAGAERLEVAGASTLAVDFARRHPDPDPAGQDPEAWALLLAADHT